MSNALRCCIMTGLHGAPVCISLPGPCRSAFPPGARGPRRRPWSGEDPLAPSDEFSPHHGNIHLAIGFAFVQTQRVLMRLKIESHRSGIAAVGPFVGEEVFLWVKLCHTRWEACLASIFDVFDMSITLEPMGPLRSRHRIMGFPRFAWRHACLVDRGWASPGCRLPRRVSFWSSRLSGRAATGRPPNGFSRFPLRSSKKH